MPGSIQAHFHITLRCLPDWIPGPLFIQWMWFLLCKLNPYETGEKRQELRFKHYYVSAYPSPGGKKNLYREVKEEDRRGWNTKDPKLNMEHPVSSSHQNMRVQPPGCSFTIIYSTRQLFTEHQLEPIITAVIHWGRTEEGLGVQALPLKEWGPSI